MVDIVTADSLRELVTPGLLAVLTPIAVRFTFGYAPLGSFLVGAIAAGVLMAVFLSVLRRRLGTTPRSWSRTATMAARAQLLMKRPSSATPWATRSKDNR